MKDLHYGQHYQYAHDSKDKLTTMQTMPPELVGKQFYQPTDQGMETRFANRLAQIKEWHRKHPAK